MPIVAHPFFINTHTMQKFKVIALSVGGKNNKIFKSGDEVTANDFVADVKDLVKGGFLKPIDPEQTVVDFDAPTGGESEDEPTNDVENLDADPTSDESGSDDSDDLKSKIDGKTSKDFKKPEIVSMLAETGEPFNPADTKAELFDQLVAIVNG